MPQIRVLDKHIAELIAAGEVVERPASVIKELVENSIDAGASHITVEIQNGGITLMRVTDDGCGIKRKDVATAFLRHATSKVRSEDDLNRIGTLGFRGEALASIAAVARVEVNTCCVGETVGTQYVIHGGEEISCEDCGCPEGTVFTVCDLFYNVPARMKFLKKDVSEGNAVAGVVERLALSHPEISLRFLRDGRMDFQTPGDGQLLPCIHAVFGKPFADGLIPVDGNSDGVKVTGYVCKPEACRQNRTMQHFFVNGRYVKTQTAMAALERAYKGVMMTGRFPTAVLCLQMPPETVDANIHPAKIEVRFINEKPVFDAVFYAVRSALECGDSIRRVLLQEEKKGVSHSAAPSRPAVTPTPRSSPTRYFPPAPAVIPPVTPKKPNISLDISAEDDLSWNMGLRDGTDEPLAPKKNIITPEPATENILTTELTQREDKQIAPVTTPIMQNTDESAVIAPIPAETVDPLLPQTPSIRIIGELFKTYVVAEMGESMFIIDKHAAHERIIYNRLKQTEHNEEQPLLAPVAVSVSRDEHTVLMDGAADLSAAGFAIEDFGGRSVLVRAVPMVLAGEDIEGLIREIAAGLLSGSREVRSSKLDWIYHSTACRAAMKAGDRISEPELLHIAEEVLTKDDIRYCPPGRPVCIEMTRKELEKQFGRIV